AHGAMLDPRSPDHDRDVTILVGAAAMLGDLGELPARPDNTVLRDADDVRRAPVAGGGLEEVRRIAARIDGGDSRMDEGLGDRIPARIRSDSRPGVVPQEI